MLLLQRLRSLLPLSACPNTSLHDPMQGRQGWPTRQLGLSLLFPQQERPSQLPELISSAVVRYSFLFLNRQK